MLFPNDPTTPQNYQLTGLKGCIPFIQRKPRAPFFPIKLQIEIKVRYETGEGSGSGTIDSPLGCVEGDPHFLTWDGKPYSYHGACDLVLASSRSFADGLGLDIHVRAGIQGHYSRITNGAVKIGDDILEVNEDGSHYFNGMYGAIEDTPMAMGNFPLETKSKCRKRDGQHGCLKMYNEYRIILDNQESIKIRTFAGLVNVDVLTPLTDFAGLIGTSGKPGMVDRNGDELTDPLAMGADWQVRDDEPMIFHNVEGPQFPRPCNLPKENARLSLVHTRRAQEKIAAADGRRSLRGSNENDDPFYTDALKACNGAGNFQGCVEDVLATRDLDVALLYVDGEDL